MMNDLKECNALSDDFANDPSIPKPVFTDSMDDLDKNEEFEKSPISFDNEKKETISAECQALLAPNTAFLYSPPKFKAMNKSPYDIIEQPFGIAKIESPKNAANEKDDQNNSEQNSPKSQNNNNISNSSQKTCKATNTKAATQPVSPRAPPLVPKTKKSNENSLIGIENYNPSKFCKFTDPFTLKAIENIGADIKDLFYPTESQLSEYSNDLELKKIVKKHQMEVTDKLIESVKNERDRLLVSRAHTQQPTARFSNYLNNYNYTKKNKQSNYPNQPNNRTFNKAPMTLPISKKRAIEQIIINKIKSNTAPNKNPRAQSSTLPQPPKQAIVVTPSLNKGNTTDRLSSNSSSLSGSQHKPLKSALLVEKVANAVIRAKEIEERKKEEKEKDLMEKEIRAQRRLQELQYIKSKQNEQIREKNMKKQIQKEIFNMKIYNEALQKLEQAEIEEIHYRCQIQRAELEKRMNSEILRYSQMTEKSKTADIEEKMRQDQQEIREQIEFNMNLHEERRKLQQEREIKRLKEKSLADKLSAEDIKRRREMLEKRKQLEKIEKMKQTQQRIQEIELQKEEQRLISELAQRTPISAEEAELCKMYEEALELENCENLNEEKLIELAQKIGMDYNSLKKRIKA